MTRARIVTLILIALLLGLAFGWMYRRWRHPTLSEQAQDAAEQLRGAVERVTK